MAQEPERPIEKLLREAGSERLKQFGAPVQLDNVTRQMLQAEVARRDKELRPPTGRTALWLSLWPRLAWGVGFATVLGLAVWVLSPRNEPELAFQRSIDVPAKPARNSDGAAGGYARQDTAAREMERMPEVAAPSPFAATTDKDALLEPKKAAQSADSVARSRKQELFPADEAAPLESTTESEVPPLATAASPARSLGATTAAADQFAASTAQPQGSEWLTKNELQTNEHLSVGALFARSEAAPVLGAESPKLAETALHALGKFRIEQRGRQIVIIGEDGTAYTGEIAPETYFGTMRTVNRTTKVSPNALETSSSAVQQTDFEVTGTNAARQVIRIRGQLAGSLSATNQWFLAEPVELQEANIPVTRPGSQVSGVIQTGTAERRFQATELKE